MNWTLFVSAVIGTIIGRLVCDYLFNDDNDDKEEKKQDERSDE